MSATSRALAVKKALRDKLAASNDLAGVQVSYGFPSNGPQRQWIGLAEVKWDQEDWATNRTREEHFRIMVVCDVQLKGGTSEEAEDASYSLAAVLEQILIDDPSIDGLCITSGFRPVDLKTWPIDAGYESQYEIEVTATCRLLRQ